MIQIDMDMPEKCGLCPLFNAEHPMYCQGVKADRKKKIVAPYGQPRPDWCPLHEVTNTDTISRRQAIDAVKRVLGDYEISRTMQMALHILPSSPSRPPWIPCSERLPEGKQEVLVTEYGDTDIGRRFEGRWLDRYGDKMKDVTAWMPKPAPYAEKRTDG